MHLNDEGFLAMSKNFFHVLCAVFKEDTQLSLTDKEKFLMVKQADSFKVNAKENDLMVRGGASQRALETRQKQVLRHPKEVLGVPIIVHAIPLINSDTGNVVGTIAVATSQEKEANVIEMSKELGTFAEELSCTSQELAGSSEELAASSQDFNSSISSIQKQIDNMDNILKYIKDVANTTNLLGLNATIEAARAGEHGRGFGVVAEEIRKLAQTSKGSTEEITITLTTIRDSINKMIDSVGTFAAATQEQSAQTEQVAAGAQRLNALSLNLLELAETLH